MKWDKSTSLSSASVNLRGSKPRCISAWQAEQNTACSSLSVFALCFWQCHRQLLEFSKKPTSYVGPTHKASWEEEPCATMIESPQRKEKRRRGSRSALLQPNRCPFPSPSQPHTLWSLTAALVGFETAFQLGGFILSQCLPQDRIWKKDPTF